MPDGAPRRRRRSLGTGTRPPLRPLRRFSLPGVHPLHFREPNTPATRSINNDLRFLIQSQGIRTFAPNALVPCIHWFFGGSSHSNLVGKQTCGGCANWLLRTSVPARSWHALKTETVLGNRGCAGQWRFRDEGHRLFNWEWRHRYQNDSLGSPLLRE